MIRALTVFLQIIGAWIFGFVFIYMLGIGNGWEVLAIPFAMTIAVVMIGGLFDRQMLTIRTLLIVWFISGIGGLIMSTGVLQIFGIFLPFIGAMGTFWSIAVRSSKGDLYGKN